MVAFTVAGNFLHTRCSSSFAALTGTSKATLFRPLSTALYLNGGLVKYFVLIVGLFCSLNVKSDPINYSNNITERFIYKDWVAYKEPQLCRAMSEFIIGGSIASIAIFYKGLGWQKNEKNPYYSFIYREYIKSYQLIINGETIDQDEISQALIEKLATASDLIVYAELYKDYGSKNPKESDTFKSTSSISLRGSSAAFRFCGFIE